MRSKKKMWFGLKEVCKNRKNGGSLGWCFLFFFLPFVILEAFHFFALVGWAKRMDWFKIGVFTFYFYLFGLLFSFFRQNLCIVCVCR